MSLQGVQSEVGAVHVLDPLDGNTLVRYQNHGPDVGTADECKARNTQVWLYDSKFEFLPV